MDNKELIINCIVECLLINKKTIIDDFYHQSRLEDFRCYKILNDYNIELNELKIELEKLIENYVFD